MSSNLYESPMLTLNTRYSKDGEKVERVVDIYESGEAFTDRKNDRKKDRLTREGGSNGLRRPPAVHRNPYRASTLLLALLCLLLVAAISVLLYKFYQLRRTYEVRSKEQQARYLILSDSFCLRQDNSSDYWSRFRCSCYFRSTELKNWSDSRADCKRRGGDLVSISSKEEEKFLRELNRLRASWIGLQSVKKYKWSDQWEWRWVDESEASTFKHLYWRVNESMVATEQTAVYMDGNGTLAQSPDGVRGWICEKQINTVL